MNRFKYNQEPLTTIDTPHGEIFSFNPGENIDIITVESFGEEWLKFNEFSREEIKKVGDEYFDICYDILPNKTWNVLDVGCGSGRWTKYVAPLVGNVEAIDPSNAVQAASVLLKDEKNVRITQAGVSNIPFEKESFDLVFSLGVLHHIPDTAQAIKDCVKMVKPGGYFLVYLYYSLDNKGLLYKLLFYLSSIFRIIICRLPSIIKKPVCDLIAVLIYMPFVLLSKSLFAIGLKKIADALPLSYYANKSFFVIRNDALDRFGTPLEQRFSKAEITAMMKDAGLTQIVFSDKTPYWHALGKKA